MIRDLLLRYSSLFFFNDTATTEIYTLSLHDALPIFALDHRHVVLLVDERAEGDHVELAEVGDRKSTRLNSSHVSISYAVFCLKKKNYTTNSNRIECVPWRTRFASYDLNANTHNMVAE